MNRPSVPPPGASLQGGLVSKEAAQKMQTTSSAAVITYDELYETDKRLRSGSYGTVYTCHHREDQTASKPYAVKIIDRSKLKQKDFDGVYREVAILQEFIGTPHIIQVIDFFIEPQRLLVVQNLAAGGDVFDKLAQRKTYSEQDARNLAEVLLEAVHAMHQAGVAHRDLKPENLLLADPSDDSSILIADFGFARHVTEEGCKTRCGTPAFVAPEVVIGLPYGTEVDMWSIGCLLYMLIGGYPPFSGKNHRELFRKIRASDFVFHQAYFGNVSDSAKNMISYLLTVNKDLRWTARQCLDSKWFQEKTETLSERELPATIQEMKRFKARRSWKAARAIIKWAATQPFWKPDAVSFAEQMVVWDREDSAAAKAAAAAPVSDSSHTPNASPQHSTATLASVMSHIPRRRFAELYELESKIRKGSYAMVWKAKHKGTGEYYAVKVISRKGLKPADDEAVMNEVAIMQQLTGKKYFLQLLDFFEEADAFYLVMEYMTGGDVFDKIVQKTRYTEKDARDVVTILLKAVGTLHDLGIAHRDIKPQNLLLEAGDGAYELSVVVASVFGRGARFSHHMCNVFIVMYRQWYQDYRLWFCTPCTHAVIVDKSNGYTVSLECDIDALCSDILRKRSAHFAFQMFLIFYCLQDLCGP